MPSTKYSFKFCQSGNNLSNPVTMLTRIETKEGNKKRRIDKVYKTTLSFSGLFFVETSIAIALLESQEIKTLDLTVSSLLF